ncbi:MAG: hypothetical protein GY696_12255 [Gammaproteobacteria bacterium]|nr:hypothetical protein [Gammaproteobacteria bacterium]
MEQQMEAADGWMQMVDFVRKKQPGTETTTSLFYSVRRQQQKESQTVFALFAVNTRRTLLVVEHSWWSNMVFGVVDVLFVECLLV